MSKISRSRQSTGIECHFMAKSVWHFYHILCCFTTRKIQGSSSAKAVAVIAFLFVVHVLVCLGWKNCFNVAASLSRCMCTRASIPVEGNSMHNVIALGNLQTMTCSCFPLGAFCSFEPYFHGVGIRIILGGSLGLAWAGSEPTGPTWSDTFCGHWDKVEEERRRDQKKHLLQYLWL